MKKLITTLFLVAQLGYQAQIKKEFPIIIGTCLDDKKINLPLNNGKYTVLAIAFSRHAEDDLKKWLTPLYETFVQKDEKAGGLSAAEVNDVNLFFIPMISGFKRFADDFKKGTDKGYWQYIVDTEKTDIKAVHKNLGLKDDDIPYFFVLNKEGKVVEMQSGNFQSTKLDKLEDAIE